MMAAGANPAAVFVFTNRLPISLSVYLHLNLFV
jgi:hypothetical protein